MLRNPPPGAGDGRPQHQEGAILLWEAQMVALLPGPGVRIVDIGAGVADKHHQGVLFLGIGTGKSR